MRIRIQQSNIIKKYIYKSKKNTVFNKPGNKCCIYKTAPIINTATTIPEINTTSIIEKEEDKNILLQDPQNNIIENNEGIYTIITKLTDILINLHTQYNIPYITLIISLSIIIRLSIQPLIIKQTNESIKNSFATSITRIYLKNEKNILVSYNERKNILIKIKNQNNKYFKIDTNIQLLITGITLPITIISFLLLNNILHHPYLIQSLKEDVISSYILKNDSTYILPATAAGITLATIELNPNTISINTKLKKYLKYFIRIITILSIYITSHFPIGLFLYWIPNSVLSLLWTIINNTNKYRKYFNLPTQKEITNLQTNDKLASQFLQSAERNIPLVDYSTPPIYAQRYPCKNDIVFFNDRKKKRYKEIN